MHIPEIGDFVSFTESAMLNNFLLRAAAQKRASMLNREDPSNMSTLITICFKILTIKPSTSCKAGHSFEIDIPHTRGIRSWVDGILVIVEKAAAPQ